MNRVRDNNGTNDRSYCDEMPIFLEDRALSRTHGPRMASVVVSIRTRKMFAEMCKMFLNAQYG